MAMKAAVEAGEKLLGKGKGVAISRTGQALGKRSADLQADIRKLEAKDELSRAEKAELSEMKKELKEIRAKMAKEDVSSRSKASETARAKKMKGKVSVAPMPFNKGGMASRKGNFDMRRGGMFMK
jgi:beta-phosphoglucomutase-like phosphatase (HAD superfamily)